MRCCSTHHPQRVGICAQLALYMTRYYNSAAVRGSSCSENYFTPTKIRWMKKKTNQNKNNIILSLIFLQKIKYKISHCFITDIWNLRLFCHACKKEREINIQKGCDHEETKHCPGARLHYLITFRVSCSSLTPHSIMTSATSTSVVWTYASQVYALYANGHYSLFLQRLLRRCFLTAG